MKNIYLYSAVTAIILFSELSLAVQIVPTDLPAPAPRRYVDLKHTQSDATLEPAKSVRGANARLKLATMRYNNEIDEDTLSVVFAEVFLREVLAAQPALKPIGAEARLLLADARRRNLLADPAQDVAAQLRQVANAFPDAPIGIAARVRLILFRTEGLIGNDVLTLEDLDRLIDEVENRPGVDAHFVATARNGLERLRPPPPPPLAPVPAPVVVRVRVPVPVPAPEPVAQRAPSPDQDPLSNLANWKKDRRSRVASDQGAEARIGLALLRIRDAIGDDVLTVEDAAQLLRQVIKAHAADTPHGARARVNLAVLVVGEHVQDDPRIIAAELRQVIAAFAPDTPHGGAARTNLAALRAHRHIGDDLLTLGELETLLTEVERRPALPTLAQNIVEIRQILNRLVQPTVDTWIEQARQHDAGTEIGANARNELAVLRMRGVVGDDVATLEAVIHMLRKVVIAFDANTQAGARARCNLALLRIFDQTNDNPRQLFDELRRVAAAFQVGTPHGGAARLNLLYLRLRGLVGNETMTLDQAEAVLNEVEANMVLPQFQAGVDENRANLNNERERQRALQNELLEEPEPEPKQAKPELEAPDAEIMLEDRQDQVWPTHFPEGDFGVANTNRGIFWDNPDELLPGQAGHAADQWVESDPEHLGDLPDVPDFGTPPKVVLTPTAVFTPPRPILMIQPRPVAIAAAFQNPAMRAVVAAVGQTMAQTLGFVRADLEEEPQQNAKKGGKRINKKRGR